MENFNIVRLLLLEFFMYNMYQSAFWVLVTTFLELPLQMDSKVNLIEISWMVLSFSGRKSYDLSKDHMGW